MKIKYNIKGIIGHRSIDFEGTPKEFKEFYTAYMDLQFKSDKHSMKLFE